MKRVTHKFTQTNDAPPERVFPLLCPVREAEWVPGWKYRLIYSESGLAELGCVFATPNEDGSETTWVVTQYDPGAKRIGFVWVWPAMIGTTMTIALEARGDSQTHAHIQYEYTALSERGEIELERCGEQWFAAKMKGWETALNQYLLSGKLSGAGEWE